MIFALRFPPPYTSRRLSVRKPEGYSSLSTPNYSVHRLMIAGFARLSTFFRGKYAFCSLLKQKRDFVFNKVPFFVCFSELPATILRSSAVLLHDSTDQKARSRKKQAGSGHRRQPEGPHGGVLKLAADDPHQNMAERCRQQKAATDFPSFHVVILPSFCCSAPVHSEHHHAVHQPAHGHTGGGNAYDDRQNKPRQLISGDGP